MTHKKCFKDIVKKIEKYFSPLGMWMRSAVGGLDVNHSVGRAQAVGSDGRPMTRVKVGLLMSNILMQILLVYCWFVQTATRTNFQH